MRLFDPLAQIFADLDSATEATGQAMTEPNAINPATGLPTVAEAGSPDVAGNPYGMNLTHRHEGDWDRQERWRTGSFDDHARSHDSWSSSDMGGGHDSWRQ